MKFSGKTVMITGGTGSFGRFMTNELLKSDVDEIRIYSRDEEKQLDMQREIHDSRVVYIIGDIRDNKRIIQAMRGTDIVYHAAALKIIPTAELNPDEVIKTNIIGTQNVIEACVANDILNAVFISTDKAVKPVNLYGMTKGIGEKIWIRASMDYHDRIDLNFSAVRYGNVIGSRGSIIPFFKQLYSDKKEIPVTDTSMTRFLITLKQAIDLVFTATGRTGDILVPVIPSAQILDIVTAVTGDPDYPIQVIGIRPGEKLHECLVNEYEIHVTDMFTKGGNKYYSISEFTSHGGVLEHEYTSNSSDAMTMTVEDIMELIR